MKWKCSITFLNLNFLNLKMSQKHSNKLFVPVRKDYLYLRSHFRLPSSCFSFADDLLRLPLSCLQNLYCRMLLHYLLVIISLLLPCTMATFSLGIRDSIMIAHSFVGEEFGPAQSLHGATYTVDVELDSENLVENSNWVIDIGRFSQILSDVLCNYNFKNLNELFPEENTTTEFMCKQIHADIESRLKPNMQSSGNQLTVKLHESHKAWAKYTGSI